MTRDGLGGIREARLWQSFALSVACHAGGKPPRRPIANCDTSDLFAEGRFGDPRGAESFRPGFPRPRFVLRCQVADCRPRGVARAGLFPSAIRKQPLLACSMLAVVAVTG